MVLSYIVYGIFNYRKSSKCAHLLKAASGFGTWLFKTIESSFHIPNRKYCLYQHMATLVQ